MQIETNLVWGFLQGVKGLCIIGYSKFKKKECLYDGERTYNWDVSRSSKGKYPETDGANVNHDGKGGHWLEKQFGINHNAANCADLLDMNLKMKQLLKQLLGIGQQIDIFLMILSIYICLKEKVH